MRCALHQFNQIQAMFLTKKASDDYKETETMSNFLTNLFPSVKSETRQHSSESHPGLFSHPSASFELTEMVSSCLFVLATRGATTATISANNNNNRSTPLLSAGPLFLSACWFVGSRSLCFFPFEVGPKVSLLGAELDKSGAFIRPNGLTQKCYRGTCDCIFMVVSESDSIAFVFARW